MSRGTQKKSSGVQIGIILLCSVMIAGAVFGGYKLSQRFGSGNGGTAVGKSDNSGAKGSTSSSDVNKTDDGYGLNAGDNTAGSSGTALNMTPVGIVYEVNSETGRIENVFIEVLRCIPCKLDLIRIAPEVSYTMTGELFRELTVDNTELPQTVTLSELYRYYHSEKAYAAGMRIISEMLNFNVRYYTAIEDNIITDFVSVDKTKTGLNMGFVLSRETAASEIFGTPGSVKGTIEACMDGAVTNFPVAERLRYLEVYDALSEGDITFTNAPTEEHNESSLLDAAGTAAILYNILY